MIVPADSPPEAIRHFHKTRVMFAANQSELLIAERGDPRTHEEWLKEEFPDVNWVLIPRGCMYLGCIYWYQGEYFLETQHPLLMSHSMQLVDKLRLFLPVKVYNGIEPEPLLIGHVGHTLTFHLIGDDK